MRYGYGYFEEDQLGQIGDMGLWRRIMGFVKPMWKKVTLAIVLSMIITASGLALPYLIKWAIDSYIINEQVETLKRLKGLEILSIVFFSVILVSFIANFFQVWILEYSGQRIMHGMRQRLFDHVLHLSIPFFDDNPVGKLVTRLTNDIQNMHEMFTSVIITVFNDLITLIGILCILFWMDWRLALLLGMLLPLMVVSTKWFSSYARDAFRAIRTSLARINAFVQEAVSGIVVIQLFLREKDTYEKFTQLNNKNFLKNLYQIKIFAVFVPLIEVMASVSVAFIVWYGGKEIIQERITIGTLAAFISYMRLFFRPIRELSQKYSIIQSAMASAERIFQLLDTTDLPILEGGDRTRDRVDGTIEFQDVSFGYNSDKSVIKSLSFKVNKGETIAVVGATGAGKTTLVNLLERFYEPDRGRILLDSEDIRGYDIRWLRKQIGLVMQDVFLVPGTLRENIVLDGDVSELKLEEILRISQLENVIGKHKDGLDTRIGEGGIELSAGEKQLLALARVLVRDPRILILDEATANVDTETEMLIEQAIKATLVNRTNIIIAHRLSTIRRASKIIVMEGGQIVEEGTHEKLMMSRGMYYDLQMLQDAACRGFFEI